MMMLDIVVGGIMYGFVGYTLCKITCNNHPDDKYIYYTVIPLFFINGCYKIYSMKK